MKINGISIDNFKGIDHLTHNFKDTVTLIHGPVGSGKTSLIQALRYGLTGELPSKPVRQNAEKASLILDCGEELCIEREVLLPAKKSVRIVGRKVGIGAAEEYLAEQINVGNEIMKIATSSEVLSKLKPAEFADIFLDASEEKMKLNELLNILTKINSKEKTTLMKDEADKESLPTDLKSEIARLFPKSVITLEDISKAYDEARSAKREYTALHKSAVTRSKEFLEIVKPEYSEKEIQKRLEEIIGVERNVAAYKSAALAYNAALANKKEQDKRIAELELLISSNSATEPDKKAYTLLQSEIRDCENKILNQKRIIQTLSDNIKRLKNTINKLNQPTCPISGKLICKTDKADCREELEEAIFDNEESIKTINTIIENYQNELDDMKYGVENYQKNKEKYDKKVIYKKELDAARARPIELPERPETFSSKKDYSEEKAELQERLDLLRRYNDCAAEYKESLVLKRSCVIYEFLTKALEPKGPVVTQFLETFADFLEDSCNERAKLLKTGFETKFIVEDGLKVLFKTKSGSVFLPYSSLSNGERIFAELILTDLVNSFCNSKILILDNVDNLDQQSFIQLLEFLTKKEVKELYDNIIVSFVNHDDLLSVTKKYSLDIIGF